MSRFTDFMSSEELEIYMDWRERQKCIDSGAIGGEETFHFTPTSIGLVIEVTNNCTGETIDVTDYKSW